MLAQLNDYNTFGGRMLIIKPTVAIFWYNELHCLVKPTITTIIFAIASMKHLKSCLRHLVWNFILIIWLEIVFTAVSICLIVIMISIISLTDFFIQTHYKQASLYHIQAITVSRF